MLTVMIFYRLSQQLCSSASMSFSSSLDFMLMCMLELIFVSGNYCFSFVFVEYDTFCVKWKLGKNPSPRWDQNRRPSMIQSDALTTALLDTPWRARVKCGSLTRTTSHSHIVKPGQPCMTHNCITQSHYGISQMQPSKHQVSLLQKYNKISFLHQIFGYGNVC